MSICAKCNKDLPENGDFVHCSHCNTNLHFDCSAIRWNTWKAMSASKKDAWKCEACRGLVSRTPVRNISSRSASLQQPEKRMREISPKATSSQVTNSDLLIELQEMKKFCEFINAQYEDINTTSKSNHELLEKMIADTAKLRDEIREKDNKIKYLESRVNVLEQNCIKNDVEISNIEPRNNENLHEIVKKIAQITNTEITDKNIADIYRTRSRNPLKSNIIVTFNQFTKKQLFINNCKRQRSTNSLTLKRVFDDEIDEARGGGVIFINNRLTNNNKHLLWLAKQKAREQNWKFVWEREGRIFMRNCENARSVHIGCIDDVNNISSAN